MDVSKLEYMFSTELVWNVMHIYGINWMPKDIFFKNKYSSPFTFAVRKAIQRILEENREFLQGLVDIAKDTGSVNMRIYEDSAKFACHLICENHFDKLELLRCCVIVSGLASLFYQRGVEDAPFTAVQLIYDSIRKLKNREVFTDRSWEDVELLAATYVKSALKAPAKSATNEDSKYNRSSVTDSLIIKRYLLEGDPSKGNPMKPRCVIQNEFSELKSSKRPCFHVIDIPKAAGIVQNHGYNRMNTPEMVARQESQRKIAKMDCSGKDSHVVTLVNQPSGGLTEPKYVAKIDKKYRVCKDSTADLTTGKSRDVTKVKIFRLGQIKSSASEKNSPKEPLYRASSVSSSMRSLRPRSHDLTYPS